jgi:hypothetical protein
MQNTLIILSLSRRLNNYCRLFLKALQADNKKLKFIYCISVNICYNYKTKQIIFLGNGVRYFERRSLSISGLLLFYIKNIKEDVS